MPTPVPDFESRFGDALRPSSAPLGPSALMSQAEAATGLSDWGGADHGEDGFRERLAILCQSLEEEAALTDTGRARAHARIQINLRTRLEVIDWHQRHPGQPPVDAPLIGTGLARSGTSFFHQLLAQDPDNLTAPMAEAMIPVPPPGDPETDAARFAFIGRFQDAAGLHAPEVDAVHPFTPENAAECLAMQASAIGTDYQAHFSIPSLVTRAYADIGELLAWEKAVMQVLGSGRPGARWLLKTPQHMGHLNETIAAFPGARLFFNHRDPAKVIPSLCSLFTTFYGLNSDRRIDPKLIVRPMLARMADNLEQVATWRAANPQVIVVDVHYRSMTADPIAEAKRVYAAFGLTLSAAARERMTAFVGTSRHAHGPKHSYSLADFGLTEEDVEAVFGSYLDRYGIMRERG